MTDLKPEDLDEIDGLISKIEKQFEAEFEFKLEECPGLLAAFAETHGFIAGYKARMKREEERKEK